MVGGYTRILGGHTVNTGDAIDTLADGLFPGMRKAFHLLGALTTNDWLLTVTTGVCANPAGAGATAFYQVCATVEFDAAA